MRGLKVSMALFVVMLFCIPPATQAFTKESETPAQAYGRGEYVQNKTQDLELKLTGGLYSNASFNVSLPGNATITSAAVDLEGLPVMGQTQGITADFASDTSSQYAAYAGSYSKNSPGSARPSTFQGSQLQSYDISNIAYSDNRYAMNYVYTEYGYHRFSFKLPLDVVSKVNVVYEGYAGYIYAGGIGTVACYIWNNDSQNWESVGVGSDSPKSSFNKDFSGKGYMWAQGNNHFVDVLAICQVGSNPSYPYNFISSDYVKIYVEGNVLTFPKNPQMVIGSAFKPAWSLTEDKFNYVVNIGDVSIMNGIQDITRKTTTRFADIRFNFKSETTGKIKISNFRISYIAPPWCTGIPDTYTLEEDTPNAKLINLNGFFVDDIDNGKMSYEIIYEEDSKKLDADIATDGWMGFKLPSKNWHGDLRFQVRATDSDSLSRDSGRFKVTVVAVNDPPVIGQIGRQLATQGVQFLLTIRVKDVDLELDPAEETVVFSDNTSLFEIDPTTGKISFTPGQEQVGVYNIAIIATDLAGATDQENFTLEVLDTEDPPLLDDIPDQSAMQDTPFTFTVTATDPDLPYGDSLKFSDSSPLFVIEAATGAISFTPSVKDIGSYKVTITVIDAREGTDSKQFTLNILNSMGTMNRPPSVEAIANQTAQEGVLFEYTVKGADPDLDIGDSLSFQDNCPVFEIAGGSGRISFKPTAKDAGVYNVRITVKDREGLGATTEFKLTVVKTNHAPNVTGLLPKDGTRILVNRQFKLSAIASDVDGDKLNYTWKDGDNIIGFGQNITATFTETGTYILSLVVSDGKLEKVNETTIEVVGKISGGGSSSTPGFESLLAVAAVGLAALGLAYRKRR